MKEKKGKNTSSLSYLSGNNRCVRVCVSGSSCAVRHIPHFGPDRKPQGAMRKGNGFSLVELLMVLAIVAIVGVMAVPSLASFVDKYRLDTASRVVWSDMQSAKMTAIKANQSINVQLVSSTAYTYTYTDALAVNHTFYRDLRNEYPGVTLSFSAGSPVTFTSLGMGQPGTTNTVSIQNSIGTRSFSINWTGRIENL